MPLIFGMSVASDHKYRPKSAVSTKKAGKRYVESCGCQLANVVKVMVDVVRKSGGRTSKCSQDFCSSRRKRQI